MSFFLKSQEPLDLRFRGKKRLCLAPLTFGALLLACVWTVGCNEANCPFTRPSCCDNALFGCGPFDLPQGCSCGDYFSRSLRTSVATTPLLFSSRAQSSISESSWRVALRKDNMSCPYLNQRVQQTLIIRSQGRRVEIKAFGYPRLRGVRSGKTIRARGVHRLLFPRCSVTINAAMTQDSELSGRVQGGVAVLCQQSSLSCSTTFSGPAQRL